MSSLHWWGPDDYFRADLQRRRLEDERLTGRCWPGSFTPLSNGQNDTLLDDQLTIALGDVDCRLLARESALRYVRASQRPGQHKLDALVATDIYAIFYYGLGLSLRPLDCTGLPHVLAVYHRQSHDVYLDWSLLSDPPYGLDALDHAAWRRAVDTSPVARILLAWCVATHIAENFDVPLVLGYSAYTAPVTLEGQDVPKSMATPLSSDTFNRYRKTITALAALLAPQERLSLQMASMGLPFPRGDPDWRVHLRAAYGHGTGWQRGHTQQPLPGGAASSSDVVEHVISVLAEQNHCPRLLVEWELDGNLGLLDWDTWSMDLLRGTFGLWMRYTAADQYFRTRTGTLRPQWDWQGRTDWPVLIQVRLAL
jgi:hypothetical protein